MHNLPGNVMILVIDTAVIHGYILGLTVLPDSVQTIGVSVDQNVHVLFKHLTTTPADAIINNHQPNDRNNMSITIGEVEGIRHMMTPDPQALRAQLIEQADGDPELLIDLVTIYCIDILNVERDVMEFSPRRDFHDQVYTDGEAQGLDNASESIYMAFKCPHPDWNYSKKSE